MRSGWVIFAVAALVLTFAGLGRVQVRGYEAEALWLVRHSPQPGAALVDQLRGDLGAFHERVEEQAQPPLYFAALNIWSLASGESIIAARLFSVLAGVLAFAGFMSLRGWRSDHLLLVAALLFIWPMMYAGPASFALLFSALGLGLLLSWLRRPAGWKLAVYGLCLMLLFLSAHVWILIVVWHLGLALRRGRFLPVALVMAVASLPLLPWLLLFQSFEPEYVGLGLLWPWLAALLPGLALLIASALKAGDGQSPRTAKLAAAGLMLAPVLAWVLFSAGHPRILEEIASERRPDQPVLTRFKPDHPMNYYAVQHDPELIAGLHIDLGWHEPDAEDLLLALDAVSDAPVIWLMMPEDDAPAQQLRTALSSERERVYDLSEMGMRFSRFDAQISFENSA